MFFLMRYQIVVASSREINFARQFSSVSLVHRIETKIARQFFEVRLFILLCSKISLMRRPPCSYIALNSARMANWKCRPSLRGQITAPLQSLVPHSPRRIAPESVLIAGWRTIRQSLPGHHVTDRISQNGLALTNFYQGWTGIRF
jgi:hypothetical protein